MKTNFNRRVLVTAFLALVSSAVLADSITTYQTPNTGVPVLGSYTNDSFETINLANLNVHFAIPILSKSGAGGGLLYNLSYDSLMWATVSTTTSSGTTTTWAPMQNMGWRAQTEMAVGYFTMDTEYLAGCNKPVFGNFVYHDPVGTAHPFTNAIWQPCSGTFYAPSQATDNSGYTLTAVGPPGFYTSAQVITRSGSVLTLPIVPTLQPGTGVGSIVDTNGNEIQTPDGINFKDSTGTVVLTASGNPPVPTSCSPAVTFKYIAPNTHWVSVTVSYRHYIIQTNFGISGINEFPATDECLVDKITLPDTTFYQFTYELTNGTGSNVTGRIASVTLPTGGIINYSYAGLCYNPNQNNCMLADGSPSHVAIWANGAWGSQYYKTYQAGPSTPQQTVTTIYDAQGNQTNIYFSGIYETERYAYQGWLGGNPVLLRETHSCYNNYTGCPYQVVTAPITYKVFFDDKNQRGPFAAYDYWYNTYGLITEERDHDFTTGNPVFRIVNTAYNTNLCTASGICDHPASVQITDGASPPTQKALTNYTYDGTGNATQISKWVSGSFYLNQQYTYNANGTLATTTDPNGAMTYYNSYGYSCNNAFPNTVILYNGLTTTYTYNCTGGVVASVTDPNGAITTTSYTDPYFWRAASTTDPLGNTTYYNYYNVKNFSAGSTMGIGQTESGMIWNNGHSTTDIVTTPDALGRPFLTQTRQAPGSGSFDTVETDYDTSGNVNQQSRPFSCALGHGLSYCSGLVTTTTYDALHRPLVVTGAGGATSTYSYSSNDVEITNGPTQFFSKELEYDALGRLTSTCEMSSSLSGRGACNQHTQQTGYPTTYTYDPLGNLTVVTQGAQTRPFTYDGVSRMLSEANPENGTTRYTYDTDTTCGTYPGNKVKRIDAAGNTTCYFWDGLHRLVEEVYPSGPNSGNTLSKRYYYDNPYTSEFNLTSTYSKDRLVATWACTLLILPQNTCSSGFMEVYSYDKRGGVTDFYEGDYEGSYFGGAIFHTVNQITANGAVAARMGYLGTTGTTAFANKLVYSFDGEGRQIGLTDQTTGTVIWNPADTSYNPAGEPNQVVFSSGDSEQFNWSAATGVLQTWQSNVGAQSQSGHVTDHLNGTVAQLQITDTAYPSNNQTCIYGYDDLARLSNVNCGATIWQQNFGYDRYGNITKSVPQGSQGAAFAPTYNTASNHISNLRFSYDVNGNVLQDNAYNSFEYDAEGRPVNVNNFTTYFDASNRAVSIQNPNGYDEIVYAPDGYKMAIMNGTSVVKYFAPLAAGVQAVYTANSPAPVGYWRHSDWQGSSRIASTASQHVYYDGSYAPFGENYNETGNDRSYTGQTQDTSPGIYDFLNREQSSNQGRWFVPDPSGMAAVDITNPQTLNRYAYVGNNPVSNVDPLGLFDVDGGDEDDDFGGGGLGGGGAGGYVSGNTGDGSTSTSLNPADYPDATDIPLPDNPDNDAPDGGTPQYPPIPATPDLPSPSLPTNPALSSPTGGGGSKCIHPITGTVDMGCALSGPPMKPRGATTCIGTPNSPTCSPPAVHVTAQQAAGLCYLAVQLRYNGSGAIAGADWGGDPGSAADQNTNINGRGGHSYNPNASAAGEVAQNAGGGAAMAIGMQADYITCLSQYGY